jgi:small subunit ribosomal protein S21
MIEIKVRTGESVDRALKRMKKKIKDEGILDGVRQRRYYIPKSEKRKKAKQKSYYGQLMREWKNRAN